MSSSQSNHLHFLLIPFLAPGHIIPMMDMAKLLAQRGVTVTIVTTPLNAVRFSPALDRAIKIGHPIRFLELPFPYAESGLPEGCESADALPSMDLGKNFYLAVSLLQHSLEQRFDEIKPSPSCIISDKYMLWTVETANKFQVPRIIFDGMSCFTQICTHSLQVSKVYENFSAPESFVVPGLPDRVEFTRAQLPAEFNPSSFHDKGVHEKVRKAELEAYGVVINSFEELEQNYADEYNKLKGGKVWCIGPLSLCNKEDSEKAQRGSKATTEESELLKWLDSWEPGSVVYACLGSVSRVVPAQLIELALGLEASNRPFIWVMRAGDRIKEVEEWMVEVGFEERTKGRALLIREWAPQVLILSHPAIGGFLTHCGWNSTLEGVCAGVPMITWPQFAEQFFNEKLVVQVLNIGAGVGAQVVIHWGEEEKFGVKVKREELKNAIEKVMDVGKESEERRKRAKELGEKANKAIEEGGSSYLNMTLLIQDIMKHANDKK